MRRDLFVALALVSLTYVQGQSSDEQNVSNEVDPISKCLNEVQKAPNDYDLNECHKLEKFKGPVCRGFMYIYLRPTLPLPYLTLCHLRALEHCTIFDGTIVIDLHRYNSLEEGGKSTSDDYEQCLYDHLDESFETPARLQSHIDNGGINVNHPGFKKELVKHRILKYTKNLVEITGALYVNHVQQLKYGDIEVESLGQLFPSLRIIRGNSYGYKQSLYVKKSYFRKIRLENLVAIVRNGVKLEGGGIGEANQLRTFNTGPSGTFKKLLLDKDAEVITTTAISETANCQNPKDLSEVKNSKDYRFCYEKTGRDNKDSCWDEGPVFPDSNATLQSYYCQIDVERVIVEAECNSLCLGGCKYNFVKPVPIDRFRFESSNNALPSLTPLQRFIDNALTTAPEDAPLALDCAGCNWANSVSFIHESWRDEFASVCFSRKLHGKYCDADLEKPNLEKCVKNEEEPVTFYHGCPAEFPWRAGELVSDLDELYPEGIHGWRCVTKQECYDLYTDKVDKNSKTIFHCDGESCVSGSCQGPSITSLGTYRVYRCNELETDVQNMISDSVMPSQGDETPDLETYRCNKGFSKKLSNATDFICTKCYDKCETYVCDFCGKWDVDLGYQVQSATQSLGLEIFDDVGLKAIVGCEKIRTNGGMVISIKDEKLIESVDGGMSKVDKAFKSLREIDCLTIKGSDALTSLSFLNLTSVAGTTWNIEIQQDANESKAIFSFTPCHFSSTKKRPQENGGSKIQKPSYPVKIQQNQSLQTLFAKNMEFTRSARVYIRIKEDNNGQTIKFSLGIKSSNLYMLNRTTGEETDISTRVSGISENDFLCPNEYLDLHMTKKIPNGKHISEWNNLIREYERKPEANKTLVLFLITESDLKKLYLDDMRTRHPQMTATTFEELYESQPPAVKKRYGNKSQLLHKIFLRTRYWLHETFKSRHDNGHQAICDVFPLLDVAVVSTRNKTSDDSTQAVTDSNKQTFYAKYIHPMNNPVLTSSMGMTINEVVKFLKPEPFNKLCWDNSTGSMDSNGTPMCSRNPPASCPDEPNSPEEPWKYKFNDVVMDDGPNLYFTKDKDKRNYRAETRLSASSCISSNTYNKIGNGNIPLSPCYSGKDWDPFSAEYHCNDEFTTRLLTASGKEDKSEGTPYEKCGHAVMKGLDDLHLEANTHYTAYLEAVINFGEDDRLDTNKKIILRSDHKNFKTDVDIANSVTFPTRLISSERTPDRNTTSLSVNYKMEVVTGKLKEFVIAYTRWTNNVGYCEDFEDLDFLLKKYEKGTIDEQSKMNFLKEVHQKCARPPQKKKDYSTFDQKSNDREFEKTVPKTKKSFTEAGFFCRLNEKDISMNFEGNSDGWCDPKSVPEKVDHVEMLDTNLMPNDTVKPEEVEEVEERDDVVKDYDSSEEFDALWEDMMGTSDESISEKQEKCNETCIFKRLSDFICDDLTRESLESRVKRNNLDPLKRDNELRCGKFFPYYAVENTTSFSNVSILDRIDQIVNYTKSLYPKSNNEENQDQPKGSIEKVSLTTSKNSEFRLNLQKRLFLIGCAECFLKIEQAMLDVRLTQNITTRVKPTEATTTTSVEIPTTETSGQPVDASSQSSEGVSVSSGENSSSRDSDDSSLYSPKDQKTRRKRQADYSSSSLSESYSDDPSFASVDYDQVETPRLLNRTLDLNILRDIFDNVKIEKVLEESERAWTTPLDDLSTGKTVLLKVYACNEGTDCGASDFLKALDKCSENDPAVRASCEDKREDVTLNLLNETFAKESFNWVDLNDQSEINRASAKTKFNTKPFKINDCPRAGCQDNKSWVPGCLTEKSEWECNNVVDKKLELVFQAPDWRKQNGYVILYEFEFTKEGGEPKALTIQDHVARKNFAEKINETKFWDLFYAASKKNDMETILNFECLNDPSKPPEKWYTLNQTEELLEFAFQVIRGESRCYLCQEPKEEWPWCDPDLCGFRLLNLGGEEKSSILDRGEFEFQIRIYTTSTLFQRNEDFYTKGIDEKNFNSHFQITTFSDSNKIIVNMADKSVEIVLVSSLLTLCFIGGVALYRSRHKKPYMTMEWTVNPDCFEPDLAQRDAYYAAGGAAQTKAEFYINVDFLTPAEDMTYIGTGNYGDIYLAEYKEPEEEGRIHKVAVKFFKDVQDTKKIHKEREAFQTLGRTGGFFHITYYFGWSYISHPSIPMMSTCLVMEYMDCKSLNHYLRTYNPEKNTSGRRADESITVKRLLKMCADVADGMFFLNEELKFIHRDLAARNCLVARHETVNGEVYETVKISDFGLTRSMINDENKDYYCLDINDIPIRWWPPESIEGGKFMSLGDIWSYGVLLFEVVTLGCMPYVDISNAEVKAEIMRDIELKTHEFNVLSKKCWRDMISKSLLAVGIPAKEADDAYNNITKMIKICCHYEPTKRPTFRDLLEMIAQFDQLNGLQDFQEEYFFYKGRQDESYSVDSDCETESTTVTETQDVIKPLLNPNS